MFHLFKHISRETCLKENRKNQIIDHKYVIVIYTQHIRAIILYSVTLLFQ